MAAQTYNVEIQGYWRDINKSRIPNHSGVYFVYDATHNKDRGTITINKLIYIGESEHVRDRIKDHEKYESWLNYIRWSHVLCFSTCMVEPDSRERVEAAYIFKLKPPANEDYLNSFPFDETAVKSKGKVALVHPNFSVHRTRKIK
ncbi:MAG: GIY-YIG nuclease family protein [Bacteroidota bacterium]